MTGFYARWIDGWERKLATRDTNRLVRPFEWGTDWLARLDFPVCPPEANGASAEYLSRFAEEALKNSDRFFAYQPVRDYQLRQGRLTFTSPARSARVASSDASNGFGNSTQTFMPPSGLVKIDPAGSSFSHALSVAFNRSDPAVNICRRCAANRPDSANRSTTACES